VSADIACGYCHREQTAIKVVEGCVEVVSEGHGRTFRRVLSRLRVVVGLRIFQPALPSADGMTTEITLWIGWGDGSVGWTAVRWAEFDERTGGTPPYAFVRSASSQ